MLFSSITFLYYFLPAVFILYFIAPKRVKNIVLLLASLFFYGWGEPRCVFLMLLTIVWNYVFGILMEKTQTKSLKKAFLTLSVTGTLSGLLYFKYAGFFVENFVALTGISAPVLNIALPIGISFYTFQILSYSVDVYRQRVPAQKNFINLSVYIALFPQLIAGPIVRYKDIAEQLTCRTHSFEKAAEGIKRFVCGLSKKVLLANVLGELCQGFYASGDLSVSYYWLFAFSYMLHTYFDFSGYSDMAIGLGKIFGFDLLENFRYPFISRSLSEFWRRWHISLGSWFRDYVYFPMGGSRVNKARLMLNLLVVWFLTGFWHGAEWNFVIWGMFFFVFLTFEKFTAFEKIKKPKVLSHIYTIFFMSISFMIFSGNNAKEAISRVGGLFGAGNIPLVSGEFLFALKNYWLVFLVGVLCATPALKSLYDRCMKTKLAVVLHILEIPVLLTLVIFVTAFLADGTFNPFLYFRF